MSGQKRIKNFVEGTGSNIIQGRAMPEGTGGHHDRLQSGQPVFEPGTLCPSSNITDYPAAKFILRSSRLPSNG